jgi:2-polyprenyl-3-methyl-5-hydroxy-6-metoxy-1,4-benzoquinol methylase
MITNRLYGVENEFSRNSWVSKKIQEIATDDTCSTLLDVGAGLSPYRKVVEECGLSYTSQDFSGYVPNANNYGIQDKSWVYPKHDYICDINEIPKNLKFDVVLCTEVLEHVPDPVRAFQHLADLLRSGGLIIVTVPFLSLMHQAPYWYQSGLSPFWFEYWAKRSNLQITELTVSGDYMDLMTQETKRIWSFSHRTKLVGRMAGNLVQNLRRRHSKSILDSGAFGTFCVARKVIEN